MGEITGPRPHAFVDTNVIARLRGLLLGNDPESVPQARSLQQLLSGNGKRWTLVRGDTVIKEVRHAPVDPSAEMKKQIAKALSILKGWPLLRQSDGEMGGHAGMRVGCPYRRLREWMAREEGHLAVHPRDTKLLADAFENRMDCILSFDKKLKVAWGRLRRDHEDTVRELVREAGVSYWDVEVLSPADFVAQHDA